MPVDQKSWEAAIRHLYEDAYPYAATRTGSWMSSR